MNPLRALWNIIKFIILDFWKDGVFLWKFIRGKAEIKKYSKEELREAFSPVNILKHNWTWLWLLVCAGLVGWFIAGKHYQQVCNTFIYENYIQPNMSKVAEGLWNFTFNIPK